MARWEYITLDERRLEEDEIKQLENPPDDVLPRPSYQFYAEGADFIWRSEPNASLADVLNELGEEGWELTISYLDDVNTLTCVLKRAKVP